MIQSHKGLRMAGSTAGRRVDQKDRPSGSAAVMAERRSPKAAALDFFPTPPWATRALMRVIAGQQRNTAVEPAMRKRLFAGQPCASSVEQEAGKARERGAGRMAAPSSGSVDGQPMTCWEPAAGAGHMAQVLAEPDITPFTGGVFASDVEDYGAGYAVGSFVGVGLDVATFDQATPVCHPGREGDSLREPGPRARENGHRVRGEHLLGPGSALGPSASLDRGDKGAPTALAPGRANQTRPDWIITNPPFVLAEEFALRAIAEARCGVALLVRTVWLEGGARHQRLFSQRPPSVVALFSERVAMVHGRWDPGASTATSYAWVIWLKWAADTDTRLVWIPPGTKGELTRPDDPDRYAGLGLTADAECVRAAS